MAQLNKPQVFAAKSLYQIGYKYLCDNFHKFKQAQKIRVAIAILQIFEKDDSKTAPQMNFNVTVEVEQKQNENQAPLLSGNRISQYVEV